MIQTNIYSPPTNLITSPIQKIPVPKDGICAF
jgi:hypothetical protein